MTATSIPEGFEPHFRKSPLTEPWEPLYSKKTDKAVIIGLRLAKPHTNGRGLIHGGLIAALSDNAMGYSCALATDWKTSFVTIGLTVDFIGSAQIGRFSDCRKSLKSSVGTSVTIQMTARMPIAEVDHGSENAVSTAKISAILLQAA